MGTYFNTHSHTHYSNIRLLDCINHPKDLVNKAIELGLSGLAITDHECLSAHMEVNQLAEEIRKTNPDFTIALGNEIYLVDDLSMGQKYYHFILIAKDALGHRCLRELSSKAWEHSYFDRGLERVPTLKSDLKEIVSKYKGHIIATTACIGGQASSSALKLMKCREQNDAQGEQYYYNDEVNFINFCLDVFGDDFYIECAPAAYPDQILVNKTLLNIAKSFNIKMVVGTDAHYLRPEDRPMHKAYLNSKSGEREVDSFYEYTYLMSPNEVEELLGLCFDKETIQWIFDNTLDLQKKISFYSLRRKQIIPKVDVKYYQPYADNSLKDFPIIHKLRAEGNDQERYWINECLIALKQKGLDNKLEYLERLETEADVIKYIGEKLDDCLFAYFNTFKHYINLFWECGSIVGPGRGSSTGFLSNYLLGITQLDPIRWGLQYWRFLNKERLELPDIDIDLAPSKRPLIFDMMRKERGRLGVVQVATFGTEGTKSAILTACRGYRGPGSTTAMKGDCSGWYEAGIDPDIAQYMSSLIPQERGFLWPLKDVVYGNPEKGRKQVTEFVNEVNNYPGLLDIMMKIEGLINKRGIHASGVMLYGLDPYETASFMKAPNGETITCWELHDAEAAGDTKYDFLVTEACDKIITCYNLLKEDNLIPNTDLKTFYDNYLHPEVIDVEDKRIWEHLASGDVLDVFQFSTGVGLAIAKKLKPQTPMEMTAANAMMRLMSEKDKESQQDRYYRIQHEGLQVFDAEMKNLNLPQDVIDKFHYHCDKYYGCCPLQEQMMEILMDIASFTLKEANNARKIVAKKKMDQIPILKQQVYDKVPNPAVADYLWETAIAPSLGYAFSLNHSLPYSFVGIQMLKLAIDFNPIYWDTACLIVNSGSLEDNSEEEIVNIYELEKEDIANGITFTDLPDRSGKIKKTSSTDYGKVAKAIGDIRASGIHVSLVDINRSSFGFKPDVENNQILFGLKGMLNVGDDLIETIIEKRPYTSPKDFLIKVNPNKSAMISFIKGGAFDKMMDRKECMVWYIWEYCSEKKKNLTLSNMATFIKYNLLPENEVLARRVYEFNRFLKAICKKKNDTRFYYLNDRAIDFLLEIECEHLVGYENGTPVMEIKSWDKVYQKYMDIYRKWLSENKIELLDKINQQAFLEAWDKYAKGNLSSWEMEVLCFYHGDHELKNVKNDFYGFSEFKDLPVNPVVEKSYMRHGHECKLFHLSRICGTCIAKNKIKSTVTLLTTSGVVNVKFRKEYFALFDRRISKKGEDGVKHVLENSWFNRGNMIIVQGIRSGDDFIVKKYASTPGHQLYRIDKVNEDGTLVLQTERIQGDENEV